LYIQACPLLGYAIELCELYLGRSSSNRWCKSNLGFFLGGFDNHITNHSNKLLESWM
jgi:hypothetical protein